MHQMNWTRGFDPDALPCPGCDGSALPGQLLVTLRYGKRKWCLSCIDQLDPERKYDRRRGKAERVLAALTVGRP